METVAVSKIYTSCIGISWAITGDARRIFMFTDKSWHECLLSTTGMVNRRYLDETMNIYPGRNFIGNFKIKIQGLIC